MKTYSYQERHNPKGQNDFPVIVNNTDEPNGEIMCIVSEKETAIEVVKLLTKFESEQLKTKA